MRPTGPHPNNNVNANGSASSLQADQTIGIIVGVVLAALLAIGGMFWYRRYQDMVKDVIPDQQTRDVSMTQLDSRFQKQTHDFDSEATFSPVPSGRANNIIDIIPAKQNPLETPGSGATRRL